LASTRRDIFPRLKAESEELLNLDFLRLVAACAILISHFWTNLELAPSAAERWAHLNDLSIFVDVFFAISGIVIAYVYANRMSSTGDYGSFLQKRAARLVPLHLAILAFYVVVGLVGASLGETLGAGRYDGSCLVPNILLVHATGICEAVSYNAVSWSISAEMFMYLLFPLFLYVQRRSAAPLAVAAIGIIMGLCAFDWIANPAILWTDRTFDGGVLRAFPAFLLGMSAYTYRNILARFRYWAALAPIAFIACIAGVFMGAPQIAILLAAYVLVVATYGCDLRGKISTPVRYAAPMGQLTYSLYMLHPVVGIVFIKVLGLRVLQLDGGLLMAWVFLAIPVCAGVAYLSLIWFERPMRRWLSHLNFKNEAFTMQSGSSLYPQKQT
jgi:peptidoglycan/LPS O-acetylase OafA/YrhL